MNTLYVMYDGLVLGELYISETDKLRFKRDDGIKDCWLPLFLRYTVEFHDDSNVNLLGIYEDWLSERVVPSNRIGLKRILTSLGMLKYDMFELARKTNACQLTDPYWIAFNDSDCFTKNSLRGLYGHTYNPLQLDKESYRWRV